MPKNYTVEEFRGFFKYIREEQEFTTREFMVNFSERFVSQGAATNVLYRFMMNLTGLFPESELELIWPNGVLPKQHHKKYREVIQEAGIELPSPRLKCSRTKSKTISSVSPESRKNKTNDPGWDFSQWGVEDEMTPQGQLQAAGFTPNRNIGWSQGNGRFFTIAKASGKYANEYRDSYRIIRNPEKYIANSQAINNVLRSNGYSTGSCIGAHGIQGLSFNEKSMSEMIEIVKRFDEEVVEESKKVKKLREAFLQSKNTV